MNAIKMVYEQTLCKNEVHQITRNDFKCFFVILAHSQPFALLYMYSWLYSSSCNRMKKETKMNCDSLSKMKANSNKMKSTMLCMRLHESPFNSHTHCETEMEGGRECV